MDSIWARATGVTCIHPGWNRLEGREAVMRSWRGILANPGSPIIQCSAARVHARGDVAYVLCLERVRGGGPALIATNLFVREEGGWCIVHHQAGPVSSDADDSGTEDDAPPDGGGLVN